MLPAFEFLRGLKPLTRVDFERIMKVPMQQGRAAEAARFLLRKARTPPRHFRGYSLAAGDIERWATESGIAF